MFVFFPTTNSSKSKFKLDDFGGNHEFTLPETNTAPENGWLEYDCFLWGFRSIFSGKLAVSFREGIPGSFVAKSTRFFQEKSFKLKSSISTLGSLDWLRRRRSQIEISWKVYLSHR